MDTAGSPSGRWDQDHSGQLLTETTVGYGPSRLMGRDRSSQAGGGTGWCGSGLFPKENRWLNFQGIPARSLPLPSCQEHPSWRVDRRTGLQSSGTLDHMRFTCGSPAIRMLSHVSEPPGTEESWQREAGTAQFASGAFRQERCLACSKDIGIEYMPFQCTLMEP
ncbi:MAG: hypothetical protein A4E42_00716 [Methanoregulaceae archaeon PtaU1.Bin222]|nr:MAG: hypothetical protein A4E42_00716 [Methanoregulaceae archaeon PtaU1.Bin222]